MKVAAWSELRAREPAYALVEGVDLVVVRYLAELTTAVKYGMNVTHVLLENHELGKISKEQRAGGWDVWETALVNPDFAAYATLCGALGIRVTKGEDLDSALERALAHEGPALVEVSTDPLLV